MALRRPRSVAVTDSAEAEGGPASPLGRFVEAAPGWLLLVGGVAVAAIATLAPQVRANGQAARDVQSLRAEAEHLADRRVQHEHLVQAIQAQDPAVMRRLMLDELRVVPAEMDPVRPLVPSLTGFDPGFEPDPDAGPRAWIEPAPPEALPEYVAPDTRMHRLTTGDSRWGLLVAAGLCMAGGFAFAPSRREDDEADPDEG
ncbi:MAG: hypothetical protein AAF288_09940 [Planctomycetota bacterium]